MTKSADEIIQEISEVLAEADGEFIKKIADQVLSHPVYYDGDSLFLSSSIYHAFEIVDRSGSQMFIEGDKEKCNAEFRRLLESVGEENIECIKIGTVVATGVSDALNKMRKGDWEYERSVPNCKCSEIKSGDDKCMCDVCARMEILI